MCVTITYHCDVGGFTGIRWNDTDLQQVLTFSFLWFKLEVGAYPGGRVWESVPKGQQNPQSPE